MKEETLLQRQHAILSEIVQFYLNRREAISARTLSKISALALSPTTIRNLMEDLSLEGYLTSKGVSRGRIPTQKAVQFYVYELRRPQADGAAGNVGFDVGEEEELPTLSTTLDKAGAFLAKQTGLLALASLPGKDRYPLDWVRLTNITERRLLVAVQSIFGDLWSKVIPSREPFPPQVARDVETYICRRYHGEPMETIRGDIMSGEPKELLENMPSLGSAFRLLRRAFAWDERPGWKVWGQENLYAVAEWQQPEKMVRIHRALENPELLATVLQRARQVDGGRVAIGSETGVEGLEESSVVAYPFSGGNGWQGTIALLGPMQMDYGLVFQLVSSAAGALQNSLRDMRESNVSMCA